MEQENLTANRQLLKDFWNHLASGPYATSVAMFTPETVEAQITDFLFRAEAKKKLDRDAREEGYENAADKFRKEEQARMDQQAREKAEQDAIQAARDAEERERVAKKLEEDRILQEKRDKEDAERLVLEQEQEAARKLASDQARAMGRG